MRTSNKNKQTLYYALQSDEKLPIYDGFYTDEDGNRYPLDTGEKEYVYLEPVAFKGNIAMSGGESEAAEFGLNLSDYNAVLVMNKSEIPITETSLIWFENKPVYNNDGRVDEHSADYTVVKISPSLNVDKFVLKKVVK